MLLNESTVVSSSRLYLVPYDAHHVPTYHEWMSDPAIQEATASEPLTLEEEYENQMSWRMSGDKLTFILCLKSQAPSQSQPSSSTTLPFLKAGEADTPSSMIGDINLFLTPCDDEEEDEHEESHLPTNTKTAAETITHVNGEIDIMIASTAHRSRGLGQEAVSTLLTYIHKHTDDILAEYATFTQLEPRKNGKVVFKHLVAKINTSNVGSIALFKRLGFVQKGDVNYFGELQLVLEDFQERLGGKECGSYDELRWDRTIVLNQGASV